MRVEYLKARARKERYREETLFVQEEKRATLVSLEKEALLWDRREGAAAALKSCPIVAKGAAAYAAERAASERALCAKFRGLWAMVTVTQPTSATEGDAAGPVTSLGDVEIDDELHFTAVVDIASDDEPAGLDDDSDEEPL